MKKYSTLLLVILLALLGILSRFLFLGSIPAELHRDETSIAYNAYSLLKTGRDEHGKTWPISFQAFGDYKLPGSIYLSIPSIYFFGLNAFALRFPNALFGFLLIPAVFFLAKQMEPKNRIFAWLAAFFTATSPLFIHAARNSYEPAIAIFFEVMAMNFLLLSRKKFAFFFAFLTKQSYQKIYVAEIPLAYSYFSVYQKFSPNDFQKNAQWKQEGFHEVEEFENFRFEPLPNFYQFSELNIPLYLHPGKTRILAVQAYNQELYQFVESQVVFQVKNFEGKTLWFAYEWTPQQLSEKIDTLWPKSKTKTSTLDYLQSLNSPADK